MNELSKRISLSRSIITTARLHPTRLTVTPARPKTAPGRVRRGQVSDGASTVSDAQQRREESAVVPRAAKLARPMTAVRSVRERDLAKQLEKRGAQQAAAEKAFDKKIKRALQQAKVAARLSGAREQEAITAALEPLVEENEWL